MLQQTLYDTALARGINQAKIEVMKESTALEACSFILYLPSSFGLSLVLRRVRER